jgi:methylisocitrate lyase
MNWTGKNFEDALKNEQPLQIAGTINAYTAKLAELAGFRAIYLSGAGVANASFALPDLGVTTLNDVCEDTRRICQATDLPLLVDIDTGFGSALNISRAIKELERAGASAIHIEDQISAKRCGHRPGKKLVSTEEMCDRIKAAVDAKSNAKFAIMARTDAHASEGLNAAIERSQAYIEAGADMIFAEAITSLDEYKKFCTQVKKPVLANMTEFGKTPYFTVNEFHNCGVKMVLYPLSAFRAMSAAALHCYQTIKQDGTQKHILEKMQKRTDLYGILGYNKLEEKLDSLFGKDKKDS